MFTLDQSENNVARKVIAQLSRRPDFVRIDNTPALMHSFN